jgi:hypothetical protein
MRHARREFMSAASLAAAWTLWPASTRSTAGRIEVQTKLTFAFDARFADSRAFARRASLLGARIVALEDGIDSLWFERLLPDARSGNALAGLTGYADAFVLTRLALASGMRVTRHSLASGGLVAWHAS